MAATRTAGSRRSSVEATTCGAISRSCPVRAARRRCCQPVPRRHGRGGGPRPPARARARRHAAELNEAFERGGEGAASLAEAVVEAADHPNEFEFTYPIDALIEAKIEAIATRVYGAGSVVFLQTAKDKIKRYAAGGLDRLPICMAKTHLSLARSRAHERPDSFELTVRDIRAYTGAGWLVALCGTMQTMPGLGANPAAFSVDIDEDGRTVGLFSSNFLDAGLKEFLDAVPARTPAPGAAPLRRSRPRSLRA